jgi:hypothetical protein
MFVHGFKRLNVNHCVYIKRDENDNFIVLLLYVDDMLTKKENFWDANYMSQDIK